jgi:hypothetical protein
MVQLVFLAVVLLGCQPPQMNDGSAPYEFVTSGRRPRIRAASEVDAAARMGLRTNERLASVGTFRAFGIGHTVVQVVAESARNARAYVVDEDGLVLTTKEFWAKERSARQVRFGKMTPELFDSQQGLSPNAMIEVDVMIAADVPQPQRPFDGTNQYVPIQSYKAWIAAHSQAQQARIAAAKADVLNLLASHGASIVENPHGLPTIRALVPVTLLQSQALNGANVVRIDPVPTMAYTLLGFAGRAAMNAPASSGGLQGGMCAGDALRCDGGGMDVGLWERDFVVANPSGLARNNSRISTANRLTGYLHCPTECKDDSDCPNPDQADVRQFCRAPASGEQKICVQDHLTWTAASVGMYFDYAHTANVPSGPDPVVNAPQDLTFAATGAWHVDHRIGNDNGQEGLDYLIAPSEESCAGSESIPTPYVNRSATQTPNVANWAGRAFGTFVTAASGNDEAGTVQCARLKNGLCVGMFDYKAFDDMSTHRRTSNAPLGSSFVNDAFFDESLERPHLLGPGNHSALGSGLHMPSIDVAPGFGTMRHASYEAGVPTPSIIGTSFAAPSILSVAIQAHQYAGWFSDLAFPMVNKAVLMAATRDANADGAIGKSIVWSKNAPDVDAEDGAGQVNFAALADTLDHDRYYFYDAKDSDFASCGTNCREFLATEVVVAANDRIRVALAWQACMLKEETTPTLNNDLDLVLDCWPDAPCDNFLISDTVTSELEMLERPACNHLQICDIRVRIKNGASLEPCGSDETERLGVAWSFNP